MKSQLLVLAVIVILSGCASTKNQQKENEFTIFPTSTVDRSSRDWEKSGEMLHIENIDVSGYKAARLFLHVYTVVFDGEESDYWTTLFPEEAHLEILCYHLVTDDNNEYFFDGVSMEYYSENLYAAPNGLLPMIQGWIEIPIIGEAMNIRIYGRNLPESEIKIDGTIYLLKE